MNVRTKSRVESVFGAVDAMDTAKVLSFLTNECEFRAGSGPSAVGAAAIRDALNGFFSGLTAVRHEALEIWEHPGAVIIQGEAAYTRTDRRVIKIPFVDVWRIPDDKIHSYLIYADFGPLGA